MLEEIELLLKKINAFTPKSKKEVENFRLEFLSKKGKINSLFKDFKTIPKEKKQKIGEKINELKNTAEKKIDVCGHFLSKKSKEKRFDLTRPVVLSSLGSKHPVSIVRNKIVNIFGSIGFNISTGPEIEDDWHNFSALNIPKNHPARDMQDTFFIQTNPDLLLRTHTSSVQVRHMQKNQPPIRTISPGRVYRNESISARAHCLFHQVEGLYIAENVSFIDLKKTLLYFAKEMFGEETEIRLRPSYFPFTEPSAEVDVSCNICNKKGCAVCKKTGYLEILGCGMVDPAVLDNCGIDSKKYSGYAFGMGVERIAMLKYGVDDLRLFFENDVRFLKQFSSL